MQTLRWDDVRVFLSVYRERSLSVAAVMLGLNPLTAGRRIAALEAELGVQLFDRRRDGATPTVGALELLPIAERMEQAAFDVRRVGSESEPAGTVVIVAPPGIAEYAITPVIPELLERYPRLVIEVDTSARSVELARREADLAVRTTRPSAVDLVAHQLDDAAHGIFASPELAGALGALGELAGARWITWRRDRAHAPSGRWVAEHVPESAVALRTNSLSAQLEAVRAGVGVCLLPEAFAGRAGGISPVELLPGLAERLPPMPVDATWLVGARANSAVPRIAAVWDFIIEKLGGGPGL